MVISVLVLYLIIGCLELFNLYKHIDKKSFILYIVILIITLVLGFLCMKKFIPQKLDNLIEMFVYLIYRKAYWQ